VNTAPTKTKAQAEAGLATRPAALQNENSALCALRQDTQDKPTGGVNTAPTKQRHTGRSRIHFARYGTAKQNENSALRALRQDTQDKATGGVNTRPYKSKSTQAGAVRRPFLRSFLRHDKQGRQG